VSNMRNWSGSIRSASHMYTRLQNRPIGRSLGSTPRAASVPSIRAQFSRPAAMRRAAT
jgi:hypothetical protein